MDMYGNMGDFLLAMISEGYGGSTVTKCQKDQEFCPGLSSKRTRDKKYITGNNL